MYKLFSLVVLIIFVQFTTSTAINDAIKELTPTIKQNQILLGKTARSLGERIGLAHRAIEANITQAQNNISSELQTLSETIADAEKSAKKKQKDIRICTDKAENALDKLNFDEIDNCKNNTELFLLTRKFQELGYMEGELGRAIPNCLAKCKASPDVLTRCVESVLEDVSSTLEDLKRLSDDLFAKAAINAENCVENTKYLLINRIEFINFDFVKCIKRV